MPDNGPLLIGIDVGTTHCKAGLFAQDGAAVRVASRPTETRRHPDGYATYDPESLWAAVAGLVGELAGGPGVAAVGVASMAETGLLVDRASGRPRTPLIPWFDTVAVEQAARLGQPDDPLERFCRMGIRPSFKCSLAKLLWLAEREPGITRGAVWLSAADYIAFRLSGALGTDYSLAGRTYAFRIDRKEWDADWLADWGFSPELFPPAGPSGRPLGWLLPTVAAELGLPAGAAVAVCGHDHVAAALALGAVEPGRVFDSMGTAEALIGALPERPLTAADYHSGLAYGCHTAAGRLYWMGGLSASGGSVEWMRDQLGTQLGGERLSYAEMEKLLAAAPAGPTGILYFPYLRGSGSPHPDPAARGALIGLSAEHNRADLLKAILEGTGYELEYIREVGAAAAGHPVETVVAAGGGTRNPAWLQIKADISGCRFIVPAEAEATLLGAAMAAGMGCGTPLTLAGQVVAVYRPDDARHAAYRHLYEDGFLTLQEPLRRYYRAMEKRNGR